MGCADGSGRVGALILTGGLTPWIDLPVSERERHLLTWKSSRIPLIRRIYNSLVMLSGSMYIRSSPTAARIMGYDPKAAASPPDEGHFQFGFVDAAGLKGVSFDAIIVGSGSGGGVAAKTLSEAGMSVLVVEKGDHFDPSGEAYTESEALDKMYQGGGLATNDYGDLALISASVFGGGSTVNWAACLQTPAAVRADWAKNGLPYFQTPEFQEDLDAVFQVMGVSQPTKQDVANSLLLEGARRLGYAHANVPQNNGGVEHKCGHNCANSCRSGGKKGGVHSWLIDASRAGAKFVTGVSVRRIIFNKNRAAEGVLLRLASGEKVTILAPRVLVCAGSMQSPALLLRSRVPNPRIGQSLYLHPTNYVYGVFKQPTYPTDGNILTSVVGEFANLTPSGHGVRIEAGIMQPIVGKTLMQWENGAEYKARVAKHPHTIGLIAIARDRDHGKVVLDPQGEPAVFYNVSPFDVSSIVKGTIAAAECLRAVDAEEIIVAERGVQSWKKGDDFDKWIEQVKASPPGAFGSAHQMASNRMAAKPKDGACDPHGRVYGVSGVWCADASVLPSASGVNPMVSTMAVARKVARGVVGEWKAGVEGGRVSARL